MPSAVAPDDVDAVALVQSDATADPWRAVQHWVAGRTAAAVTDRARLLGLPAATLGETPAARGYTRWGGQRRRTHCPDLLVVDLSSMWAGPLCAHLLARAGATVVKVEARPDPTAPAPGPSAFFDWMNGRKASRTQPISTSRPRYSTCSPPPTW